jgi:hypothetical protein
MGPPVISILILAGFYLLLKLVFHCFGYRFYLIWGPLPFTADHGKIVIPWRDVQPLDQMEATLSALR